MSNLNVKPHLTQTDTLGSETSLVRLKECGNEYILGKVKLFNLCLESGDN